MGELSYNKYYDLLANAFVTDPMCMFLFKDDKTRFNVVRKVFAFMFNFGTGYGHLITTNNVTGIIVYTKSYKVLGSLIKQIKIGAVKLLFGIGIRNFWNILCYDKYSQMLHSKYAKPDDYYLYIIAVDPKHHRNGFGGKMILDLQKNLEKGERIYVETSNPDNILFYEKFGFELQDDFHIPKSNVHIWPMIYVRN